MAHISVRDVSVQFDVFESSGLSLKNTLISQATGGRVMANARNIVSVRAIDRLNVQIHEGDRIGLVGHNGSGKTTLLRVLAGIYKPVTGTISISGRVSTLLDSSAGMDAETTGIENIYLRGYILGRRKPEIEACISEIAEFTDLGDFLYLPVRTYSAGMAARLAFGISTAFHDDILLIDEGIGAGDAEFQDKAQRRIERLFARSSIVVLATHADGMIRRFCNRRLTMEHGRLINDEQIDTSEMAEHETTAGLEP